MIMRSGGLSPGDLSKMTGRQLLTDFSPPAALLLSLLEPSPLRTLIALTLCSCRPCARGCEERHREATDGYTHLLLDVDLDVAVPVAILYFYQPLLLWSCRESNPPQKWS
jgi:hypothetical protein